MSSSLSRPRRAGCASSSDADQAIRLLDPSWQPPKTPRRPSVFKARLPRGQASQASLRVLKAASAPLTTAEVIEAIVKTKSLAFVSREDREDFTSSIAMALRRYERRGVVTSETAEGTKRLRWRLRRTGAHG